MEIYLFLGIVSFLLLGLSERYFPVKIMLTILVVFIAVIFGLRFNVGMDYESYYSIISEISKGNSVSQEVGFVNTSKFLMSVGFTPNGVIFFFTIITSLLFSVFINQNVKNVKLGHLLYFLLPFLMLATLNQIRQFLAVAIFINTFMFIKDRKIVPFLLLIGFGALFHKSILLLIPLYFFSHKSYKLSLYIIAAILIFGLIRNAESILSLLNFSRIYFIESESSRISLLSFVPAIISFWFIFKYRKSKDSKISILKNMLFLYSVIVFSQLFTTFRAFFILRYATYFTPFIIMMIDTLIEEQTAYWKKFYLSCSIAVVSIIYFYITIASNGESYHLVPFNFNFSIF